MMKRCVVSLCFLAVIAVGLYAEEASAQEYSNQPGYERVRELVASGKRQYLRRAGVSPRKAEVAIWALAHKPESSCALLARNILQTYGGLGSTNDKLDELGEGSAMSMEDSDICERRNLDKYTYKPTPLPPYDKNKDSRYLAKIFFRDHELKARQYLADAGIAPQAIDNVVQLFAEDPKFHRATYQISLCAEAAAHIVLTANGDPDYRIHDIGNDVLQLQAPRECDDPDPVYMH